MSRQSGPPPVIGMPEIAALFDVKLATVHAWRGRGQLIEEDWVICGIPMWKPSSIQRWASRTGRLTPEGTYQIKPGGRPRKQR